MVLGGAENLNSIDEALAHLNKRKAVLGGVVLSGGEPCLYDALAELIAEIKRIGGTALRIKLDTNGMFPAVLEKLFSRREWKPDYIAMDLKLAPQRYSLLLPRESAAAFNPAEALTQSAALIRKSGIAHEFRSLNLPNGFFSEKDIKALAPLAGNSPWHIRPFQGWNCLDPAWDGILTTNSSSNELHTNQHEL